MHCKKVLSNQKSIAIPSFNHLSTSNRVISPPATLDEFENLGSSIIQMRKPALRQCSTNTEPAIPTYYQIIYLHKSENSSSIFNGCNA